jgi:hypothetical protein
MILELVGALEIIESDTINLLMRTKRSQWYGLVKLIQEKTVSDKWENNVHTSKYQPKYIGLEP